MKTRLKMTALWAGLILLPLGCKSGKTPEGSNKEASKQEREAGEEKGRENAVKLTNEQIQSAEIQVVKAARKPFGVELAVLGEIATDTDRIIQLRPDGSGTVKEVLVAVGDTVESNTPVVRYLSEGTTQETKEIKAPHRGVIVGLYAQSEGHVDPAVPLVTLADTSRLRCGLDVYEKDISQIHKGQKVRVVATAYPNEKFEGVVTYISPRVDENSRTIRVRVDVANPGGKLKFGMFVRGFIQVGNRETLVIPEASVQKMGAESVVFVAEDGNTFVRRPVALGDMANGQVEVKSGVREGESVVGKGSFTLKSEFSKGEIGEEE